MSGTSGASALGLGLGGFGLCFADIDFLLFEFEFLIGTFQLFLTLDFTAVLGAIRPVLPCPALFLIRAELGFLQAYLPSSQKLILCLEYNVGLLLRRHASVLRLLRFLNLCNDRSRRS